MDVDDTKQTFMDNLKSCLGYVIGFAIIIVAVTFFINRDAKLWMGMFYSTDTEQSEKEFKKGFETIDECRDWAQEQAEDKGLEDGEWDYDCGTGCKI